MIKNLPKAKIRVIREIRVLKIFVLFVFKKNIISFVFKYFIRVQKQPFLSCSNDVVMMFIA